MPPKIKVEQSHDIASATTHKAERNYLLNVRVKGVHKPRVMRTLSVPPSITFWDLHCAIQAALEWHTTHLHFFEVVDIPANWLGDANVHPNLLDPGPRDLLTIGEPNPEAGSRYADENTTKLSDVFEQERYRNKRLMYTYDYGDNWEHIISFVGHAERSFSNGISCIAGEGAPIAEDCGAPFGWQELKEIVKHHQLGLELDDDQRQRLEWFRELRHGDLEIWDWDMDGVNGKLSNLITNRVGRGH
jgi:Plasmid pRiA4b ORF-3-like protein